MANSAQPDAAHGCWEWTKGTNRDGYGRLNARDPATDKVRCYRAHRVSFAVFAAPDGADWREHLPTDELDHLCVNARCINPDHLEEVTRAEQLRRRDERRGWGRA